MIVRSSRHMARLVVLALTALSVVVGGSAALAGEPASGLDDEATTTTAAAPSGPVRMTVEAGLNGMVAADAPLVVDVELASDELVEGTLELRFRGSTRVAVEVPAGGVKHYALTSPVSDRRSTQYTVTLTDGDGDEIVTTTGRVAVPDTEVVGVMGVDGVETAIRSARTTPLLRTPEVVRLEPEQVDARIAPLGYIVAGPGSLGRLTDDGRLALSRWVRDGGRLLGASAELAEVAEPVGDTLLAGTGVTLTRFGTGELGLVDAPADLAPDEWSRILRDTPGALTVIDQASTGFEGSLVVAASSGQEAAVPALPWLLAGILLFIVLVGPVNMLVLRAFGKPEWSWVTIPALSLLFLGGFWVVGRSQVLDYTANHASVLVDDGLGHSVAESGLLVQVSSGGEHVLALPDGWQAFPAGTGGAAVIADGVVSDSGVRFDLDDLGLGATVLRWDADPVALSATVAPGAEGGLDVTVTNDTPWTLASWGVVVSGRGYGSREPLPPGASGTVEVEAGRVGLPEPALVAGAMTSGEADYEVMRLLGGHLESTWPVLEEEASYVFGVTSGRTVPVEVDSRASDSAGTTLLVRRLDLGDDDLRHLGSFAPELLAVDGASSIERYGAEIYAYGADALVLRYAVPAGLPGGSTLGRTTGQFDRVEVWDWDEAAWTPFGWEQAIDPARHVSAGGELLVRASVEDTDAFVDRPIRMQDFSLRWTA